MWGKSQLNRRNIVLVALTTASVALGAVGTAQAQDAAAPSPVPTRAQSMQMLRDRLERLKDPAGNYPQDDSTARCNRTATSTGRKCSVTINYPELTCTDSTVMTSFTFTSTGTRKAVITGLKLRCVRTIELTDDEDPTNQAPAPAPIAIPVPVAEPAPAAPAAPVAAPAAPVAAPAAPTAEEQRAAERERQRQIEAGLIPPS
jgi:hypothetical protein